MRNIPSFFILFISFAATFLMGCSGGGGGGSGGPDEPTEPITGPAPAKLASGMKFQIVADEYRFYTTDSGYWFGPVDKTITLTADDSVVVVDNLDPAVSTGGVTYVRHNNNRADLLIENYIYKRAGGVHAFTTMRVELTFQSDTGGAADEVPVDATIRYELRGGGTFTYTPPAAVTTTP